MNLEPINFTGAEDDLQSKFFQWAWNTYPEQRMMLFHINQKSRNAIEGNQMKAKGVVAGVTDMCLVMDYGETAWIELKTLTGKLREKQILFRDKILKRGHKHYVCRDFESLKNLFIKLTCND